MNDLTPNIPFTDVCKFADDTTFVNAKLEVATAETKISIVRFKFFIEKCYKVPLEVAK